jgi:N-dimethylarginine dimethylaminohydrolase
MVFRSGKLAAEAAAATVNEPAINGHSMVDPVRRVMVCSPRSAGWNQPERVARWRDFGFLHSPNFEQAQLQHEALCRELEAAGAEVFELPPHNELTLDAVYTHDTSLPTDFGLIIMRAGKPNRVP